MALPKPCNNVSRKGYFYYYGKLFTYFIYTSITFGTFTPSSETVWAITNYHLHCQHVSVQINEDTFCYVLTETFAGISDLPKMRTHSLLVVGVDQLGANLGVAQDTLGFSVRTWRNNILHKYQKLLKFLKQNSPLERPVQDLKENPNYTVKIPVKSLKTSHQNEMSLQQNTMNE